MFPAMMMKATIFFVLHISLIYDGNFIALSHGDDDFYSITNALDITLPPSYSSQDFQFEAMMEFDKFRETEMSAVAQKRFQRVCSLFMTNSLNGQSEYNDNFVAIALITDYKIIALSEAVKESLRTQESNKRIRMFLDIGVSIRSDVLFSSDVIMHHIASTLDEKQEKDILIDRLQDSHNEVFHPISEMTKFVIDIATPQSKTVNGSTSQNEIEGRDNIVLIVVVSLFAAAMGTVALFLVFRRWKKASMMKESFRRESSPTLGHDGFAYNGNGEVDIVVLP